MMTRLRRTLGLLLVSPLLILSLSGCAAPEAAAGTAGGMPASATAPGVSFDAWLAGFKAYARGQGISQATIDRAFRGVRPLPEVIEADGRQPEFERQGWAYLDSAASPYRVSRGQAHLAENDGLLSAVSRAAEHKSELQTIK